jgi:hypothetical protein
VIRSIAISGDNHREMVPPIIAVKQKGNLTVAFLFYCVALF